ncbi:MAG: hypothetical protein AVDCRST_MAG28-3207 [uncultured Rubrobacteraceae bacterium]|uniref:V-type proton ATPase subunit E n=1 Tax=uncultured Rubrobacteraceae bacterium TaxID=349277 RepID=A0A6J4R209_9ACTN|nr:MAG: hypothetical protein AVDCRST_MAG28-3207 [uncultured Rubrobacteraceae bacterium]
MSPLNDLLAAIEAEAKEERARLEAESRAEAEVIMAEAQREAAAAREEILGPLEAEANSEAEHRTATTRLQGARLLREAREEAFGLLLAETSSSLAALRGEEAGYHATLRALLREGLAALPGARSLRVDPRDEALAAELLKELGAEYLALDPSLQTSGGLVLESGDGRTLRNTFEERLANAEPGLRLWYGRRLDSLLEERR